MTALALKDLTLDDLAAPIAMPQLSGTGGPTSVSEFARRVTAFETLIQERISGMIARRQEIANYINDLVARSPDILPAILDHIDGIIGVVSGSIDKHKALLEPARIQIDQSIARSAAADRNGARFLRKLQKRLFKAEISFINSMIEHYYFFLALKADHDPDAHGGPSFSDPAELTAYLREQIEV
jgi:hypothetical protein